MASKAVAVQQESQVPALAYQAPMEIDQEDVVFPKLKIGQFTSQQVKDQLVVPGSLYTATSKEDPDPVVLSSAKVARGTWTAPEPIRVHILGMTKGRSLAIDGELKMWRFNDPEAPSDSWVTYNYVVAVPEYDEDVPAKWLLTKSGKPSAQQINTVIKKAEGKRPAYAIAFEVTTDERHNDKGDYFVPQVREVEADPEHVKVAEALAVQVSSQSFEVQSTGDEPAI